MSAPPRTGAALMVAAAATLPLQLPAAAAEWLALRARRQSRRRRTEKLCA